MRACAPSRSALFTTKMSATSMSPAFMACTESPDSGTRMTTVVSACLMMSSSVCPTPTVSTRIQGKPAASMSLITSPVAAASPPRLPRVAMLRMNTFSSSVCVCIRMRSPSTAPPVKGLEGSTAMMATRSPSARSREVRRSTRVDFPAPGGPVTPTTCARPKCGCTARMISARPAWRFSTRVMRRARARRSPASIRSTRGITPVSARHGLARRNLSRFAREGNGAGRGAPGPGDDAWLLLGEGPVALELDLVRQLEEEKLWHRDAVVAQQRAELRAHLDVVAGEAEALLRLDLIRSEPDIGDARVRHHLHRLLLDGEDALDLGRHLLAGLQRSRDLDALDLEHGILVRLVGGVKVLRLLHVLVTLGHARVERGQVNLDGARAGGGLGGIHGEVARDGSPRRGAHNGLEGGVGLEGGARVVREHLEVHGLGKGHSWPRRGQDEGEHTRREASHHPCLLVRWVVGAGSGLPSQLRSRPGGSHSRWARCRRPAGPP